MQDTVTVLISEGTKELVGIIKTQKLIGRHLRIWNPGL